MAENQPIDDDGYLALLEDARSALYRLLQSAEPGTGLGLHTAYNSLKDSIRKHGEAEAHRVALDERHEQDERMERISRKQAENEAVWKRMPRERRESVLFQVLGDGRLTIRELASGMEAELNVWIHESNARPLVMAMFREGQLERVEETFMNKPRFRYFRKRGLDGPIVDLERAYHHDDDGGES